MIDRFHAAFQTLAANPGIGQAVDRYRKGIRCFSVGSYAIFFKATDEQLVIYRVLHGARDLDAVFKRAD
jgi:toxin ParE1/3/4